MQTFDLKASERKGTGKGVARTLRRQGLIPAVLYGPATASIALTISAQDLEKVYEESGGENVILNLIIENGGTQSKTAMIKEVQTAPLTSQYLHIDFYEISLEKEITVKVQVEPIGKCKGAERGGLLQLIRYELDVSCLPGNIPGRIEVRGVVLMIPPLTMKMFSPLASETYPSVSSMRASSYPILTTSLFARTEFT